MAIDPTDVRVDLLKFRQKVYLSYPENSQERKVFLKTILENEISLARNEIPESMTRFVSHGSKAIFNHYAKSIGKALGAALISGLATVLCSRHPFLFVFSTSAFTVSIAFIGINIYNYFNHYKNVALISKYVKDRSKYIDDVSNKLRQLEGPHGH